MANNGELIEIPLTRHMFESQILAEAVLAHGYEVELLTDIGDNGNHLATNRARLLVRKDDEAAVKDILGRSFPVDAE